MLHVMHRGWSAGFSKAGQTEAVSATDMDMASCRGTRLSHGLLLVTDGTQEAPSPHHPLRPNTFDRLCTQLHPPSWVPTAIPLRKSPSRRQGVYSMTPGCWLCHRWEAQALLVHLHSLYE